MELDRLGMVGQCKLANCSLASGSDGNMHVGRGAPSQSRII
jgi:hypothetical protein